MPNNYGGTISIFCDAASLSPSFGIWSSLLRAESSSVYGAFGMHPHNAKYYNDSVRERILECLKDPRAVAWGEIGLDYAKDASPRDVQRRVFAEQVREAVQVGKPIVVHSRKAEEDTLEILREHMPVDWRVHIHCFTDSADQATRLVSTFPNAFIGFTGNITFQNAEALQEAVRAVPLDRILMETDGPYMMPYQENGSKPSGLCHPGHIPIIARKIASLKNISLQEVYTTIRENTHKMYNI